MLHAIVAAALAAFNMQALPNQGQFVIFHEDGQARITLDAARIERDGQISRVPVIAMSGPEARVGRIFAQYPYVLDCANRRFRVEGYSMFTETLAFGRTYPSSQENWSPVSDDAPIGRIYAYVCTGQTWAAGGADLKAFSQAYWDQNRVAR